MLILPGSAHRSPRRGRRVSTASDPLWSSVSLLIGGDGTNGQQDYVDESSNATPLDVKTATYSNAITPALAAYGTSLDFNVSGEANEKIQITNANSGLLDISNSLDMTFEAFIYMTVTDQTMSLFNARPSSNAKDIAWYLVTTDADPIISFQAYDTGAVAVATTGTGLMNLNAWYHVVAQRNGAIWRIFIDGVLRGTDTESGDPGSTAATWNIGWDRSDTSRDFSGYMNEIRVTRAARYNIGGFTAPTTPFPRQ